MKRPATLLLTGAIVAAGAVWYPTHAAAALCGQPAVSAVTPQFAAAGSTVTISGSNFIALTCNTTANIGGVTLTQNQLSVSSNAISFTAQPGMHGGIQVIETGIGGSNVSNANIAFYTAPTVSGLTNTAPTAAQGTSISGSGFNFTVPSGDEKLTATYLSGSSGTCAAASASLTSDTAIAVSAPGHYCDGAVALSITAPADLGNPTGPQVPVYSGQPGHVDVKAVAASLASAPVAAGSTFNVTGSGFGTGGSATIDGAAAPSTWSDTSVAITVPDTAVSNSTVALTRATDNAAIAAPGTLSVDARVDGISPTSAHPGDTVTVTGGGFGTHAGTVSLASANATVSSWSPTSITFAVPAAAQSGQLTITPVDTGAPAAEPTLTVTVSFTPGGGGAGGSSGSSGSNSKPLSQSQVQQVTSALSAPPPPLPPAVIGGTPPPIPPSHPTNGPVALSLKTPSTTAKPGKTVPFTVTLLAYGRPVGNAPVQMVVAYEPAPDALITPMSGVTDAKGQFHGTIRLSKTPGEMIVLARTGEFSDEVRLLGTTVSAATAGGGQSGANALTSNLPYAIVALAVLLLLVGIGLRIGLFVASKDSVRAALIRERAGRMTRPALRFLGAHVFQVPPGPGSGRDVQPGGSAPAQVDVTPEEELAAALHSIGADPAPDEAKEHISVGP